MLEVLFVFGFEWGVPGSAWSTVIAQVGAAVAFAVVSAATSSPAPTSAPAAGAAMAPLLTAGRHLLLRVGSMLAVFSGATAIAARVDEPTLAAHQIAASLLLFLALALDALAIPAQTLVAEELGRRLDGWRRARPVGPRRAAVDHRRAALAGVVARGAARTVLPHAFTADEAVVARATSALWWLAVMLVPAAIAFAYDGVLIGAGDYRFLGLAARGLPDRRRCHSASSCCAPAPASPASGPRWPCGWCLRAVVNHHRAPLLTAPLVADTRR